MVGSQLPEPFAVLGEEAFQPRRAGHVVTQTLHAGTDVELTEQDVLDGGEVDMGHPFQRGRLPGPT